MTRGELISVVENAWAGKIHDPEAMYNIVAASGSHVPHPDWIRLVFDPPDELGVDPTAAQVVDFALAHVPPQEGARDET